MILLESYQQERKRLQVFRQQRRKQRSCPVLEVQRVFLWGGIWVLTSFASETWGKSKREVEEDLTKCWNE